MPIIIPDHGESVDYYNIDSKHALGQILRAYMLISATYLNSSKKTKSKEEKLHREFIKSITKVMHGVADKYLPKFEEYRKDDLIKKMFGLDE